jgi:hypothetical protein
MPVKAEEERQPHENGLETCLPTAKKEPVSERVSFARACDNNVQLLTCAEAEAKGAALFRS